MTKRAFSRGLRVLRGCLTAATIALATGVLLAQQPQPQQPPVFRSGIEAVQIDVFVTDTQGNPVSGLTIDDFELVEYGKPQPITTFEAVNIPIERAESGERLLAEPDVLTNVTPPGRVYLFALDEVEGANVLRTRRFVRQFIEEHFGPHDVGAIAMLGRGLATDGQDFTSNRRLLLNAIDRFSGGFGEGNERNCRQSSRQPAGAGDGRVRTRDGWITGASGLSQQMASLRSMAEMMARIPGRHKAMLVFTECLDVDVLDIVDYNGGVLTVRGEDAHAAMAAATRSNLAIYPIDPTGLSPDAVPLETIGAFRSLGEATGGFAVINSNQFTEAFERIVRENSTYYMLAFNSTYEKEDGKYVRVEVKVKRPGLTVHAREGYVAPTRRLRQTQEKVRAGAPRSVVSTALASPLATSGIPIRVFAAPFKGRGRNAAVALALELDAASLGLEDKDGVLSGKVDVRYLATDAKQNVFPELAHSASVEVKSDPPGLVPLERIRVRVVSELELPQGRYQLRVAAGSTVVAGNVVYDLEVPDLRDGPLAMSGVMLMSPSEPMVLTLNSKSGAASSKAVKCYSELCKAPVSTNVADVPLTPSITEPLLRDGTPGSPTTQREFGAGDQLVLFAEVYDNTKRRATDPPRAITLTTDLRDADGKVIPLASEQRLVTTLRDTVAGSAFRVYMSIPDVPKGGYVLRVQAGSGADEGEVVTREIPIRVK